MTTHIAPTHKKTEPEPECTGESIGFSVDEYDSCSGMTLCTEILGFESSNIMVSDSSCDCCSTNRITSEDCNYSWRKTKRLPMPETEFPPPLLSSLSANGRRSFTLNSVRSNGRLEIARVSIDRPHILHSSRQNGRLRLYLARSDDDCDEGEEREREIEDEATGEKEERESPAAVTAAEEERDWKIPAVLRCYHQREVLYVWGEHQNRCVTTM